jgi:hypothetical protein
MNIKKPDVTLIAKFLEDNRGDTNDAEFAKRYVRRRYSLTKSR